MKRLGKHSAATFAQFMKVFQLHAKEMKASKQTKRGGYTIEMIDDFANETFNPFLFFEKEMLDRAKAGDGGDGRVESLAKELMAATREEFCKHNAKHFAQLFVYHGGGRMPAPEEGEESDQE